MFRWITLSLSILLFAFDTNAQLSIRGNILGKDSLPLPFASVSLVKGTKELSHVYADSIGKFQFSIAEPSETLGIIATYLNRKSDTVRIGKNVEQPLNIYLKIDAGSLQNVTVGSGRPFIQRKEDRYVYTIEGNTAFENKSVLDLFKTIPRITVNGFNIGITGQGVAAVLINNRIVYMTGKELIDYLSVFRTEIASIEVIPVPPAKYDAEGTGGLINIITKKGKAMGLFGDIQSITTRNSYWQQDGYANIRYRNKNLNAALNVSYGQGDYKETVRQSYLFHDNNSGWFDRAHNKNHYDNAGINLTADYQLSARASLNLSVGLSRFKSNNHLHRTILYQTEQLTDSSGVTGGNEFTDNKLITASLSLHKDFKSRKGSLDISADIFRKTSNTGMHSTTLNYANDAVTPTGTFIDLLSNGNAPRNISSIKLDLQLPAWFFKWNTEAGLKLTHFGNHSTINYDQQINGETIFQGINTSDRFSYKEENVAGYFQAGRQFTKWQVKTGIRYEGTFTHGQSESSGKLPKRSFHNFFPSVFLQYKFSDDDNIGISYSRRISRPRIWDINPYRWYTNIYSFTAGNPYLFPSYQNNIELSATVNNKFFATVYCNRQTDPILTLPYNSGIAIENRKINSGRILNYGVTMDLSLNLLKIVQSSFGATAGSYSFKTPYQYNFSKKPLILTFNTNQSVQINSTLSAAANFSAAVSGGGFNITRENGNYKLDVTCSKTMFKNRFEIRLSIDDIFKSSSPVFTTSTPDFFSQGYNYYDFRYASLALKYKFGKALRVARNKSGVSGTERMRL